MKYIRATSSYGAGCPSVCEVAAHVEGRILGDVHVGLVLHAVDVGGQGGQLGQEVENVLQHGLPVDHLAHALVVALDELRLALHGQDALGEEGHGMGVAGRGTHDVDDVLRQLAALLELLHQLQGLIHGRHFAGHQVVEETLDVGILVVRILGQRLEGLGNRLTAEADALEGVQVRNVGHQAANTAGTTDGLGDGDIADLGIAILLEQAGRAGPVLLDLCFQDFFQTRHVDTSSLRLWNVTNSPRSHVAAGSIRRDWLRLMAFSAAQYRACEETIQALPATN
jgi:hypothetical protein